MYRYLGFDYRVSYDGVPAGIRGAMVLDFSKSKTDPNVLVNFTQVSSIDEARKMGSQTGWKTFWIILMSLAGVIGSAVAIYFASPDKFRW